MGSLPTSDVDRSQYASNVQYVHPHANVVGGGTEHVPDAFTSKPAAFASHGLPYTSPSQAHAGRTLSSQAVGIGSHVPPPSSPPHWSFEKSQNIVEGQGIPAIVPQIIAPPAPVDAALDVAPVVGPLGPVQLSGKHGLPVVVPVPVVSVVTSLHDAASRTPRIPGRTKARAFMQAASHGSTTLGPMGFDSRARALRGAVIAASIAAAGCGAAAESPEEPISIPTVTASATASAAHTGVVSRAPRAAEASLFSAMPAECRGGRVFVQLETLLGGSGASAIDALGDKVFETMPNDRGKRVKEAMKEVGLTTSAIREAAICLGGTRPLMAMRVNLRALRTDLTDAFIHLFEASDDQPTREVSADGTLIVTPATVISVIGDVATIGATKEQIQDALMVGGGARPFDEASGYAVWFRTNDASGGLQPVRGTFKLDVTMPPPSSFNDQWRKDPAVALDQMRDGITKVKTALSGSPLKAGAPILDNMTIERSGEEIRVSSTFPQAVLLDVFDGLGRAGLVEIMKVLSP